jgi:hypothetical protein
VRVLERRKKGEAMRCSGVCKRSRDGLLGELYGQEEHGAGGAAAGKLGGARGGLGDGSATWRSRERANAGWGAAGAVLERHVARRKAAWHSWGLGTWLVKAAQRETERGGLEVDKGGPSCNSPKVQGLHYKAELTFKP